MYLIAKNRYRFDFPVSLQKCHLLDIWHLNKAHWFTLFGVEVGDVFVKSPDLVRFNLHRFGKIQEVIITQLDDFTRVEVGESCLEFQIETAEPEYHYLNVSLKSNHKILRLIYPLIQIIFFLTVVEDRLYYEKH